MTEKPTYEELEKRIQKFEKLESDFKKSEKKYRFIMEVMKDPIYICSQDYRVEYANPAMAKRIGRDIIGENCFKAIHDLGGK